MKICLLSTQKDHEIGLMYWKGSHVDNIFSQVKKIKKTSENSVKKTEG